MITECRLIKNNDSAFQSLLACLSVQNIPDLENQDWHVFLKLVHWHRISVLVYQTLMQESHSLVPTWVLAHLKLQSQKTASRALLFYQELHALVQHFHEQGIAVISLKGPVLAHRLYGDLGRRAPRDLDLLISPQYIHEAHALLIQQGYQLHHPQHWPDNLELYAKYQKDMAYIHPDKSICIELHWRLFNNPHEFTTSFTELYKAADGEHVKQLPPEMEFIYLAYHGSTHAWSHLYWLCDLKQYLLVYPELNSASILSLAKHWKAEYAVLEGCMLVHELFGIPIDTEIHKAALKNKKVHSLIRTSKRMLGKISHPSLFDRVSMIKNRAILNSSFEFKKAFFMRMMLRFLRFI